MCPVCKKLFKKQQHNCIKTLVDERDSNLEKLRIASEQRDELKEQEKRGNQNDLKNEFRDMPPDEFRLLEEFYGNVYQPLEDKQKAEIRESMTMCFE